MMPVGIFMTGDCDRRQRFKVLFAGPGTITPRCRQRWLKQRSLETKDGIFVTPVAAMRHYCF